MNEAGEGGVATATLGGNVFGGLGGTVELPFSVDAGNVVFSSSADFLGAANLTFGDDGSLVEAIFEAPPALNASDSRAILSDFEFGDATMSFSVLIEFGAGAGSAESEVTASCA